MGVTPPDERPADSQVIAATWAFSWTPDSAEHHCMVAVVADSWGAALSLGPIGVGSNDGLAEWIYANGALGWRSANIQATP